MPLLDIPDHIARDALLYAPQRHVEDAVTHILVDYPRLVAEVRKLRSRVAQLDREGADFDARLEALQAACRAIMDI
ncbi:hypothetical protein THL1_6018 (plasmid) [Pseudomonas sp. TCU-HL1]|nr:hypothetical protein THL1_3000 [Pseudomonas sp. TCU-HL1]AOE85561.1 hypothetical protein THL1_3013 [Pseudomonas sp. TCU-HL1]AOE88301.1 hypothetical protein THL1_6004 [Pseudomonas sp. TCU-HL1]AOE88315.1 hypothetical protein THL1_6018 [Pseudomonas sp. TCU-HL1]